MAVLNKPTMRTAVTLTDALLPPSLAARGRPFSLWGSQAESYVLCNWEKGEWL